MSYFDEFPKSLRSSPKIFIQYTPYLKSVGLKFNVVQPQLLTETLLPIFQGKITLGL